MRYKTISKSIKFAMAAGILGIAGQVQAGAIFITGHDSDEHSNFAYMSAGLDFLNFGTASNAVSRATKTVAVIDTFNSAATPSDYITTSFSADAAGILAALTGGFHTVFINSGNNSSAQAALVAASGLFTTYFNAGGSLYINTDEGFGQSWYDFVPNFGTAVNNSISTSGVFAPTAAGLAIGLTDAIVDSDITHSFFTGVDTSLFTVFEVTDGLAGVADGTAVAFGARDITIGGGGFNPNPNPVPEPTNLSLLALGLGFLGWKRLRKT